MLTGGTSGFSFEVFHERILTLVTVRAAGQNARMDESDDYAEPESIGDSRSPVWVLAACLSAMLGFVLQVALGIKLIHTIRQ